MICKFCGQKQCNCEARIRLMTAEEIRKIGIRVGRVGEALTRQNLLRVEYKREKGGWGN